MPTYAKSTYDELINVLLSDLSQIELKRLPPQVLMDWILRAEERICQLTTVREEFVLRYSSGVADYALQNRTAISGATNASPIVVTAAAHGVANHKRVFISGSQGNRAANGTWFASSVGTDTLTLNGGAYISGVKADTGVTLTFTTETPHGFTTGQTPVIANGPVPSGLMYTVTVIDAYTFTIPYISPDPDYVSGGVCYHPGLSVGDGVYSGGGRIRIDNELPAYLKRAIGGYGTYGGLLYNVRGYHIDDLNKERVYYQYSYPSRIAIYTKLGRKYLKMDPVPQADGDLNIYAQILVTPRDFYVDTPAMEIALSSEYDPMILEFMKMRAYERLGDPKMMEYYSNQFTGRVSDHNITNTSTFIDVVYK